jgi:hypothetical protein
VKQALQQGFASRSRWLLQNLGLYLIELSDSHILYELDNFAKYFP